MLQRFFIKREFFLNKNKVFSGTKSISSLGLPVVSLSFFKVKFLKPRLSKVLFKFSTFPFLALSNGGLFFYNSTQSFLIDSKKSQPGLVLFDDLYSYKNKIIF